MGNLIINEDHSKLRHLLRKNSGYLSTFSKWLIEDGDSYNFLEELFKMLRSIKLGDHINNFKTSEDLYDHLTNIKIDQKLNQVLKSIPSMSRNLSNDNLRNLIRNNIEHYDSIKKFYSKKGGRYKNIDDLIADTKSLITNLNGGWNSDSIDYNIDELIYKDSDTLILSIDNYERSNKLGSPHWCISTSEYWFKSYTENFSKQYFIYDFTKDISDNKSLIGVTIKYDGNISDIQFRDDKEGEDIDIIEYKHLLKPHCKNYISSKIDHKDSRLVIKYGLTHEFKELIKNGYVIDGYFGQIPDIELASREGHVEIVKLLLEDPRVDPSIDHNTPIEYASYSGHSEVVKLLLSDPRVDPSDRDNFIISHTCKRGHLEVIKLLLEDPRVDPSDRDNSPIEAGVIRGYYEIVKLLIEDPRVNVTQEEIDKFISLSSSHKEGNWIKVTELLSNYRVNVTSI